jgi:hypothetical protein
MVYDFGSVREEPRALDRMGRLRQNKSDRSQKQTAAQIPRPTEISQGLIGRSHVKSDARKMHVDFSHPWIVALERELIGININRC